MKVKTCLRYPGGKFYGLKKLRPFLNIKHEEYREPFVGGGSVFLDKSKVKINWINDIDEDLINFYKVIQDDYSREELYELLKNEVASKERHAEIKNMIPINKIEKAFKFFYLNRTSFSGIMVNPRWGYKLGSSVTPERWTNIIDPVAKKLDGVIITCLDYKEIVKQESKCNDILLYLDPPYFKASKAIYSNEFKEKDHYTLSEILEKTNFKFVLSYENSEEIKNMYNWAYIHELDWTYFLSEGRRQNGKEVIITNFKVSIADFR